MALCGLPLDIFKRVELCPQALNRPYLHFEGAGNGPVVITWIGRVHELYRGVSPILLVEHCVTFRHDRRLLSLLRFIHNWPTSRWSATKKENRFSFNENRIITSFLGRQFYRSTPYYRQTCDLMFPCFDQIVKTDVPFITDGQGCVHKTKAERIGKTLYMYVGVYLGSISSLIHH